MAERDRTVKASDVREIAKAIDNLNLTMVNVIKNVDDLTDYMKQMSLDIHELTESTRNHRHDKETRY